ncbi:bifunctional diaminohydroxyphosphoribosylaminopyrimidine deaminase/5-amino-6-(5-phosphoribosylamino)uracil reductase RibD [Gulosibacter chungangensis]|uniref:Riboflavin biosynthesis protein RibD n=2 Tax=Gulosibacter chungangensis TaxID=979746 RepID=A0A7J5BA82_9MICO|nr:bifunctional diaminohydroxyphosphoribosylaminopyrimidine deaminase/5-amino-6-(5-phosphoribosylamino)uracil reductase RibD [Gulosibacter chungangensis]
MRRAIELAYQGPAAGPNPRVGCVILAADDGGPRRILGEGYHRGAGTPHAEVDALRDARERASLSNGNPLRGATAIVTLEPCSHTGRTGPCTEALAAAGIREVIYAVDDPNPEAAGGATYLRDRDIRVESGVGREEAFEVVRVWATSLRLGRPFVTLKLATTLDGKIAAEDGTSQWITSSAAREHAHRTRSEVGAILVGTGTVLSDDPSLTARDPDGTAFPQQPLRVALGHRQVPMDARMRGNEDEFLHLATRDPAEALAALADREIRHVLVEGGASVAAAFLKVGLVDELHTYLAPMILGSGKSAVDPFGIETLTDAERWHTEEVRRLGQDTFIRAVKLPAQPSTTKHPGA